MPETISLTIEDYDDLSKAPQELLKKEFKRILKEGEHRARDTEVILELSLRDIEEGRLRRVR